MEGTIQIGKKEYKYSFRQKSRRLFMESQGIEYWDDYAKKLEVLQPHPKKGMGITGMTVFAELVIAAVQSEQPDFKMDPDDMVDQFIDDPKILESLMENFTKSVEQVNESNSPKANPSSSGKKSKGVKR